LYGGLSRLKAVLQKQIADRPAMGTLSPVGGPLGPKIQLMRMGWSREEWEGNGQIGKLILPNQAVSVDGII